MNMEPQGTMRNKLTEYATNIKENASLNIHVWSNKLISWKGSINKAETVCLHGNTGN